MAMSQSERRSCEDRRAESRGPDRREMRNPFECAYDVVHDIYKWTDVPAQQGETGVFKRNWRSWFGHATVATVVVALGRWMGLHASFFFPPLGIWIPPVFAFAVVAYYFNREYGRNGDYWKRRKGYDSESDSVIDFWVVLPPVFILMQISLVYAVLVGLVMSTSIYLMALYIDE